MRSYWKGISKFNMKAYDPEYFQLQFSNVQFRQRYRDNWRVSSDSTKIKLVYTSRKCGIKNCIMMCLILKFYGLNRRFHCSTMFYLTLTSVGWLAAEYQEHTHNLFGLEKFRRANFRVRSKFILLPAGSIFVSIDEQALRECCISRCSYLQNKRSIGLGSYPDKNC